MEDDRSFGTIVLSAVGIVVMLLVVVVVVVENKSFFDRFLFVRRMVVGGVGE